MTYTPAVGTILSPPLIEGTTTRFHLFCPLNNTVLYNRRQELTHNVIPLRETEVKLNGQNFTEILPPEVLYNIFDSLDLRSLSRCAQVNERWNLIANNLHFYRDIDLKMYWDKINTNTLEKLRKKLQKVRKLDMTWCNEYQLGSAEFAPHEFIDSIERILEEAKETLTHLCLNHASWISKTILHRIFDCSNLEELRLRNIHFRDFNYWSMSSNTVMKLKTLDVSMSGIEKKHLTDILKNSPNLENLIMDDCRRLKNPEPIITTVTNYNKKLKTWSSSSTFSGQDSSQIYGEFGKLIYLEYLDLSLCEPEPYRTNCLENIAMNCKKLKRLELAFWKQLTDQQLLPIITRCKELSHLNLTKTTKISPMALSIACNNLPNLRHLCIYSSIEISKEMIEDLTQKYPKVKMYNLK
ncbi:hypothetical protein ABEB36_011151 [Hypothenemus hampei]|uniref:F-box domain-containing protein n=1 Tax=Hypothenemus hampei TaxID=57062 RepID=A0ABD1EEE2_HYPHA